MSNLIPFPVPNEADEPGADFLRDPAPHAHAVQFYESDAFLVETVVKFLTAGVAAGDRLIVIATPEHRRGFSERLSSTGVERGLSSGQLTLLDARETLGRFMVGEMPDPDLFRDFIGRVMTEARDGRPQARIRAYGEMVDLLWKDGNARAAIRLEELWNEAGKAHGFSLLCAYVMGNFYREGDASRFMEICRNHSHVIPTEEFARLEDPNARLREISLLQQRARALETEILHRKELEEALRGALRERSRIEEELRASVKKETQARQLAEASDAFKEMFIGILGHDLRNPLSTVLTSARLMQIRNQLGADDGRGVERIVASGARMERMIEQMLDVARARLAEGIPITRGEPVDLVPLVGGIAEELQAVHPGCRIEVRVEGTTCLARVDSDRLEQLISNLLGNALTHGDRGRPVTLALARRGPLVSISVHNFGAPIELALFRTLFDPFKRGPHAEGRSEGLGLGLYIAERIVDAHGGRIEVESTVAGGTRFEVILPLDAT